MGCLARLLGDQERVASPVHDANVLEGFGEPWINRSGCVIQGLGRKSWYTQKAIKRKHLEVSNDKELYAPLKMKEQETDLWVEPQRLDYRTGQFGRDRDHPCRRATAGHQSCSTTGAGAVNTLPSDLLQVPPIGWTHLEDRKKERKDDDVVHGCQGPEAQSRVEKGERICKDKQSISGSEGIRKMMPGRPTSRVPVLANECKTTSFGRVIHEGDNVSLVTRKILKRNFLIRKSS